MKTTTHGGNPIEIDDRDMEIMIHVDAVLTNILGRAIQARVPHVGAQEAFLYGVAFHSLQPDEAERLIETVARLRDDDPAEDWKDFREIRDLIMTVHDHFRDGEFKGGGLADLFQTVADAIRAHEEARGEGATEDPDSVENDPDYRADRDRVIAEMDADEAALEGERDAADART